MVSLILLLFLLALATRLPMALLIMFLLVGGVGFFFGIPNRITTQEPIQAKESAKVYQHSPILNAQKEVDKHVKSPIRIRN